MLQNNITYNFIKLDIFAIFGAMPFPCLLISSDLRIVWANTAYVNTTAISQQDVLGIELFKVFPDFYFNNSVDRLDELYESLQHIPQRRFSDKLVNRIFILQVPEVAEFYLKFNHGPPENVPNSGDYRELNHIVYQSEDLTSSLVGTSPEVKITPDIQKTTDIEIDNRILREANHRLEQRVIAQLKKQCLAEEIIVENELRFHRLADSIPQMVWIVSNNGDALYYNKQWADYTGIEIHDDAPRQILNNFIHPHDQEFTMIAWSAAREGGANFNVEHRLRSATGEYRWFLARAEPYLDPHSAQIAMWFGTSTDVHDRKVAEGVIRAREEQLRLAIDAADIGEWDVDMVAGTLHWPPSVKRMFGISAAVPVTLQDYYDGIHPDDRESTLASFENTANTDLRVQYEVEYRTIGKEDHIIRWVAVKGRGLFNDAGECVRIIGTAIDISKRKASEEALRDSEERLREADRRKDEFLAMLAHELRNPLAPISAAAKLLQLGRLDYDKVRRTSQIIDRQVTHMSSLVDDLLDVSRVTSGLVELDKKKLDVNRMISDAIEQVNPLISTRRHRLELHLTSDSASVLGDRKRLVQVLANILNNSAKYTDEGGAIQVRTDVDGSYVHIVISDNGIGMVPEMVTRAFDLFVQAERSSDRSMGGLGLGLAIVKSLVELHDGKVVCESAGLNNGSKFTISLPIITVVNEYFREEEISLSEPIDEFSPGLKIMVVDDNVDASETLAMLLEAFRHKVVVAHDPFLALEMVEIEQPQVFLLDIGLPKMSGNELARRLRAQPHTAQSLLIAVTGYGQQDDRKRSSEAGFDYHLVKPIDNEKLIEILNAYSFSRS